MDHPIIRDISGQIRKMDKENILFYQINVDMDIAYDSLSAIIRQSDLTIFEVL